MGETTVVEFDKEGVWVTAPIEIRDDVSLRPAEFTEAMGTEDGFHPLRVIGNLKFGDQPWYEFSPPVHVRVRYTCMDLFRAMRRGRSLALAYWDGERESWVRFSEEHRFRLAAPDEEGGHADLDLRAIGDPAISWGT